MRALPLVQIRALGPALPLVQMRAPPLVQMRALPQVQSFIPLDNHNPIHRLTETSCG